MKKFNQLSFIKRYVGTISALTVFVAFVIGMGIFNYQNNIKLAENSNVLNAIGQEKTLSQKISKDILLIQQEFTTDEKFNASLFSELLKNKQAFQNLISVLHKGGNFQTDNNENIEVKSISDSYDKDLQDILTAWAPLSSQIDALSNLYNQIKSKGENSVDSLLVARKNRTFVISDSNETLPNDLIGNDNLQLTDRAINPEQNDLKNALNSDLQETTRILKNNNLSLLNSIEGLNEKLNNNMLQQKKKVEQIQFIAAGITALFFLLIIFFFFGRLIKADLKSFREQKEKIAILENVREGLFLMNEDWLIEQNGSNALSEILGFKVEVPTSFWDILAPMVDEKTAKNAKEFVKILFTKDVKEAMIASLNPLRMIEVLKTQNMSETILQKKKFLSINFNKIKDENGKVSKLLVTILDSTEQRKLEEKLKEEKYKSASQFDFLLKVIQSKNKSAFFNFFTTLKETIHIQNDELKTTGLGEINLINVLNKIQREIHTLKSEAGLLELSVFQSMLHDFEEKIIEIKKKKPIKAEDLHIMSFYHKDILEKTEGILQAIEQSENELSPIEKKSVDAYDLNLEQDLKKIIRLNSEKLNKKANCSIQLNSLNLLNNTQQDKLRSILIHLVNNSIAHGIENSEQRNLKNKYPIGNIQIFNQVFSEGFNKKMDIHVVDDGAGIDFNKIKTKAMELGYNVENATSQELLKFIFLPNFTTKDKADEISGHGIGMDYVKKEVENLGGKISIKLRPGNYTDFYFSIPFNE